MVAAAIVALVPVVRHPWLCDDIFITFRTVQNGLDGHGLVYNPGERVEGYTHFLWAIVLWAGARLGFSLESLGRWLPLVFDLALVVLLARTGARVFGAARSRLWGVPLAAALWAVHTEARAFASGGLETSAYSAFLFAGFYLVAVAGATSSRATVAGSAAFALAALTRPEGLAHWLLAAGFVAWRERAGGRAVPGGNSPSHASSLGRFVLVGVALVAPLYIWRLAYYGDWVPNPVRAKSAAQPYWTQGLAYVGLYFRYYAVLAAGAVAGAWWLWRRGGRRERGATARSPAWTGDGGGIACAAAAHAMAVIATTIWVGGDFMFARFLLPATPFLCLLCEAAALAAGRVAPLVAVALAGGVIAGGTWRRATLEGRNVAIRGIADERSQYPDDFLVTRKRQAEIVRRCVEGTNATFLVQGAQASWAYYARLPVAIEAHGLTDRFIAQLPLERRGRPGHERRPPFEYLVQRRTHFLIHLPGARTRHEFAHIEFGGALGEILVYDRTLMQRMAACEGIRFTDFPAWFDHWIERAPTLDAAVRRRQAEAFGDYYFDANADPARRASLEAVLRAP